MQLTPLMAALAAGLTLGTLFPAQAQPLEISTLQATKQTTLHSQREQRRPRHATVSAAPANTGNLNNPIDLTGAQLLQYLSKNNASSPAFTPPQQDSLTQLAHAVDSQQLRLHFHRHNATPAFIKGLKSHPANQRKSRSLTQHNSVEATADQMVQALAGSFRVSQPEQTLRIANKQKDALGYQHLSYQQHIQGIAVFGRELKVHIDRDGDVVSMNGQLEPLDSDTQTLTSSPAISEASAVQLALTDQGLLPGADYQLTQATTLSYYPTEQGLRLSYEVHLMTQLDNHWQYFIDASSGEVLHKYSHVKHNITSINAADALGIQRQIDIWQQNDGFYIYNPTIPLDNPPHNDLSGNFNGRNDLIVYDAKNGTNELFFIKNSSANGPWDPAAVSAMYNTVQVYNYFKNTHNRDSYDNKNGDLKIVIHYDQNMDNAFWNGVFMIYGDGDQDFTQLARCLDVAAHEMSHGVDSASSNLIYENQSGAIDESLSDTYASFIDREDWLIGEDCTVSSPGYLRNMQDPHLGLVKQPKHMSEYRNLPNTDDNDHGGVHINSGIPNRAAYLIVEGLTKESQGQSIGYDKAEKIYYRAQTVYLTSTAQFIDLRRALVQAALDIHGDGSTEQQAVIKAFDLVGIVEDSNNQTPTEPNKTDPISGDDKLLYLYPNDGSHDEPGLEDYDLYAYHFAANFSEYNPDHDVLISNGVKYTRPSAAMIDDVATAIYVGTDDNLYFSALDGSNQQQVTSSNNLATMAFAANGKFFAFTTNDWQPEIHVLNMATEQLQTYNIPALNYQSDASSNSTILYADSLSFNFKGNVLAFDVANCISLPDDSCDDGGGYVYWSIGLLNVNTGSFSYPLVNQDPNIDIGFPVFANTNENVIALDIIDYRDNTNGVSSTVLFDINKNQLTSAWQHGEGFHASVPAFWADDSYLVFTARVNDDAFTSVYRLALNDYLPTNASPENLNPYASAMASTFRSGVRADGADVSLSHQVIDFGDVKTSQGATIRVTINNPNNMDIDLVAIETSNGFQHNGINQTVPREGSYAFDVTVPTGLSLGNHSGQLSIRTELNQQLQIPINVNVISDGNQTNHDTRFDHNGDGRADILWRNSNNGQNWLYQMTGSTISQASMLSSVPAPWIIAGRGDFDGDGQADLLWRNPNTGVNWIHLIKQGKLSTAQQLNSVPVSWQVIAIADSDGDGKDDIFWRHTSTGQLWRYGMNGLHVQNSSAVGNTIPTTWQAEAIGDFSGDGRADILWRHQDSGELWLYQLNGAQISQKYSLGKQVGPSWQMAGMGDFNGDGQQDILWRNLNTGLNWFYLLKDGMVQNSFQLNTISDSQWQVGMIGDLNGDGHDDIVWRQMSTGLNWFYQIVDGHVASNGRINTVAGSQWHMVP